MNILGTCSDIKDHLEDIAGIASGCDTVVEFGVREGCSTQAIINGKPKRLFSYDIGKCSISDHINRIAGENGVEWTFIQKSSHDVEIPECDFLFIDSEHTYECMKKELSLHKNKAKLIGFHDTVSFPDINKAIEEECGDWKTLIAKTNCNGFLLLERPAL